MPTPKKYAVYHRRDPTMEVFGHGCSSKEELDQWVANMPGMFVTMAQIEPDDEVHGYIPAPE